MSNFEKIALVVVTDKTFPRDFKGRPDATKFAEYRLASDLTGATVLLIADGYPAPGMRDDLMVAISRDLGWETSFLNTTRTYGNENARTFDWWMARHTTLPIAEIVFYGRGLWDERHTRGGFDGS